VSIHQRIEQNLAASLMPEHLEVINESSMHSVPVGSETHFKVVVVSEAFEGKSLVERHRLVYAALSAEIRDGIHALAITSRTPAEWEKTNTVPKSPPCLGGSKTDA
jgi:BolA protein